MMTRHSPKIKYNPQMWEGINHKWKPFHNDPVDWNIAHVRNSIAETGGVPPERKSLSINLFDSLLSSQINGAIAFKKLRKDMDSAISMHMAVNRALKDNNLLRAKALMIDWQREYH